MVAKLSLHLAECREEQQVLETWWKPRVDVTNEGRWIDGFSEDELRGCFRFGSRELRELMCLLEIPTFLWARGSARRFRGGMHFGCCFVDLRDVKKVSTMLSCLTHHLLPFRKCTTWFCIMFIPMPWLRCAANCGKMSSHRLRKRCMAVAVQSLTALDSSMQQCVTIVAHSLDRRPGTTGGRGNTR